MPAMGSMEPRRALRRREVGHARVDRLVVLGGYPRRALGGRASVGLVPRLLLVVALRVALIDAADVRWRVRRDIRLLVHDLTSLEPRRPARWSPCGPAHRRIWLSPPTPHGRP